MRCQKHDERSYGRMLIATAQPPFSSPSIRSAGTTTSSKNTSANSRSPLIISSGATVIPGVSMSTKNAVMPRWRESAGPVRVRSTQRSEYWARLVQTFWPLITHVVAVRGVAVGNRAAAQRRQVASRARLREPLAPHLGAREQAGDDLGGELGRREVDERSARAPRSARRARDRRGRAPRSPRRARCAASASRPRPPTRSGHPYCIQPASNRIDFTRCIWATCSSSVPGGRTCGASSSSVRVEPGVELGAVVGERLARIGHARLERKPFSYTVMVSIRARTSDGRSLCCDDRPAHLPRTRADAAHLAEGVRRGDRACVARLLSLVEAGDEAARTAVASLAADGGRAYTIGITGAPGVGKVVAHRSAGRSRALARRLRVGARHRPIEPAYRRCDSRRPRAHGRARHRSRRLHPLDGDARATGRTRGGHAAGDPSARRQRDAMDRGGDGWRRPGGDRHRRRDRHDGRGREARAGATACRRTRPDSSKSQTCSW